VSAHQNKTMGVADLRAAIAASAEGYSFPINLDRDPPKGGLAPETQQALFTRALAEGLDLKAFTAILDEMRSKQLA
jgi:hypothetical protein